MVSTELHNDRMLKKEVRLPVDRTLQSFIYFSPTQRESLKTHNLFHKGWGDNVRLPIHEEGNFFTHPDEFANVLLESGQSVIEGEMVLQTDAQVYYVKSNTPGGVEGSSKRRFHFSFSLDMTKKTHVPLEITQALSVKHASLESIGLKPEQTMLLKQAHYVYPVPQQRSPISENKSEQQAFHALVRAEMNLDLIALAKQMGRNIILFTDSTSFLRSAYGRLYPDAPEGMEKIILVNQTEFQRKQCMYVAYRRC